MGGIRKLDKMPDAIFVVDAVSENVAIDEAKKNNIPVIGICDVDADPKLVDYPIPANDDSKPTIEMIVNLVGDIIQQSKNGKK